MLIHDASNSANKAAAACAGVATEQPMLCSVCTAGTGCAGHIRQIEASPPSQTRYVSGANVPDLPDTGHPCSLPKHDMAGKGQPGFCAADQNPSHLLRLGPEISEPIRQQAMTFGPVQASVENQLSAPNATGGDLSRPEPILRRIRWRSLTMARP